MAKRVTRRNLPKGVGSKALKKVNRLGSDMRAKVKNRKRRTGSSSYSGYGIADALGDVIDSLLS